MDTGGSNPPNPIINLEPLSRIYETINSFVYAAHFLFHSRGGTYNLAAKKNPLSDKAYKMYKDGMKLIDIASELQLPPGTVRRWKSTYGWDNERSESKSERSYNDKRIKKIHIDDGTKETLQNEELTPEQQLFCIYYSRTFNATQSYLKAYECDYYSAKAHGYELLQTVAIREEIERLKELKRQQIMISEDDIVELQMRIAGADMGNYVSFGKKGVKLHESETTDTQLIQEVKEGKSGVSIKLSDRQKAIDWLSKYFLMHPESKYKAEYERKRAEVNENAGEEILKNMQTIADILRNPACNRDIEDFEDIPEEEKAEDE